MNFKELIKLAKKYFTIIFKKDNMGYCDGFNCATCKAIETDTDETRLNKHNRYKNVPGKRWHYYGIPYSKCKFKNDLSNN